MRRATRRTAVIAALVTLAVACSDAADEADEAVAEPDPVMADTDEAGIGEPVPSEGESDGEPEDGDSEEAGEPARPVSESLGRRVIRTATIELEVREPSQAVGEVTRIAERAGGFVATANIDRDDEGELQGTITLRVPSGELLATLDELDALADGPSPRTIDERDVTVESADLDAQLTNLTAYEHELRTLLGDVRRTTDRPEDLLTVFERIREVRAEIDVIQNRVAVLDDQVALATITATIGRAPVAVQVADVTWQPVATARAALVTSARALTSVVDGAIWLVLGVAPVVVVSALPFGVAAGVWWRLRRRGVAVDAATPPAASGG